MSRLGTSQTEIDQAIFIYRDIFQNIDNESLNLFFNDTLIRDLWLRFYSAIRKEEYFLKPIEEDMKQIYQTITTKLTYEYGLPLPVWWMIEFPLNTAR